MTEEEAIEKSKIPVSSIEDAGKYLGDIVVELTVARLRGNAKWIKEAMAKLALYTACMKHEVARQFTNSELYDNAIEQDLNKDNNSF